MAGSRSRWRGKVGRSRPCCCWVAWELVGPQVSGSGGSSMGRGRGNCSNTRFPRTPHPKQELRRHCGSCCGRTRDGGAAAGLLGGRGRSGTCARCFLLHGSSKRIPQATILSCPSLNQQPPAPAPPMASVCFHPCPSLHRWVLTGTQRGASSSSPSQGSCSWSNYLSLPSLTHTPIILPDGESRGWTAWVVCFGSIGHAMDLGDASEAVAGSRCPPSSGNKRQQRGGPVAE